ncbi:MAG: DUF3857 domain-containing protein [Bacteroidota bacterium]
MHSKSLLLVFAFLYFSSSPLLAQKSTAPNTKWGKVTEEEWRITRCDYDSTASAIVLFHKGEVSFSNGLIATEKHIRIKILSAKGIDEADVHLPYYAKDQRERITNVDAQTINTNASGKATEQKVASNQIFDVKEDERWSEKRFSFPAVKVGSILEYRYTTLSKDVHFLEGWRFQNPLPTLYSEFKANISESLDYRFLMQGDRLLKKYKESTNVWSLQNLPAIKPEPYVYNHLDYIEKLQFQLAGYYHQQDVLAGAGALEYVNQMTTWEKLAEERLEDENYTRYLNRHGVAKDIISSQITGAETDLEKIKKLYSYVQTHILWNGTYAWFSQQPLNQALESQKANSGEINLFLVLLLRTAGLEADPVLISTRRNGVIFRSYPFLAQFNHVLVNVRLQGKDYLLDATDPFRPYDQLAENDLAAVGYLLHKQAPRWIDIPAAIDSKQATFIEADLSNPEKPLYKVDLRYTGYQALEKRKNYADKDKKGFEKALSQFYPTDYQLTDLKITDAEAVDKPFVISYTLRPDDTDNLKSNIVYLNPILVNHFTESPFKTEVRNLPVELGYLSSYNFTISIKIPTGYEVQELPTNARLEMSNKMAEFDYLASKANSIVQIRSTVKFKTTVIPSDYYLDLREFYTHIIAKYKEPLVLKKK